MGDQEIIYHCNLTLRMRCLRRQVRESISEDELLMLRANC